HAAGDHGPGWQKHTVRGFISTLAKKTGIGSPPPGASRTRRGSTQSRSRNRSKAAVRSDPGGFCRSGGAGRRGRTQRRGGDESWWRRAWWDEYVDYYLKGRTVACVDDWLPIFRTTGTSPVPTPSGTCTLTWQTPANVIPDGVGRS